METKPTVAYENTVRYARRNVTGSRISFVLAYIEIYVFSGNPFQAHSLEQITIQFSHSYVAGSWLKLDSTIIKKTFSPLKAQISR